MVQPYRNFKATKIRVIGCEIKMPSFTDSEPPKVGKQGSAFSPNYIHMIDGTVNALTIMHCANADIHLLTVCDSFWPHAGKATEMRGIYRQQFVDTHKIDLLDDLYWQLRRLAPEAEIAEPPARGDWDVTEALDAEYAIG